MFFCLQGSLVEILLKDGAIVLAFVAVALCIYLAFAPRIAYGFYRPRLFRPLPIKPETPPPMVNGVQGQDVEIWQSEKEKIHGWFFEKPNSRFTVLLSHGNGGNISGKIPLIELILGANASLFAYDYCGYGKSTGLPDPINIRQSSKCAYDYLVNVRKIAPEKIIVYGESLGGSVSALLCTTCSVRALILQSAFVSLSRIASEKHAILRMYPKWLFPKENLNVGEALAKVRVPIMIMHGRNDAVVPYRHAEELFAIAPEPKRLVRLENSSHSDIVFEEPAVFSSALEAFMADLL